MQNVDLRTQIAQFRTISQKNAISPDTVGFLLQQILAQMESLDQSRFPEIDAALVDINSDINAINKSMKSLSDAVSSLSSQMSSMRADFKDLDSSLKSRVEEIEYLALSGSVALFDEVYSDKALLEVAAGRVSPVGRIVYARNVGKFVAVPIRRTPGSPVYYNDWDGSEIFGSFSVDGVSPVKGRLYIDVSDGKMYVCNSSGSPLEELPTDQQI